MPQLVGKLALLGLIAWSTSGWSARAAETDKDFAAHVAPLLVKTCLGCHGATDPAGGLDLTRRATALAGGDSEEPAIVPGEPLRSYLLARVRAGEMPPEGKGTPLTKDQVSVLARWIEQGASWPADRVLSPYEYTTKDRAGYNWWSLQPVSRPAVPKPKAGWGVNPIDAFVLRKLQAAGLSPSPPADRRALLRRVTFDLIGLPPTPEEIDAFVADDSPDAYRKVVERLLASPHYGERWARHWLDIAHYADTHGFERDFRRDHAWPYRDYVIESLNADLPYNTFLREQIAGDVIAPGDPRSVTATGFVAAGPWDFVGHKENKSPVFKRLARAGDLDDMVTTVMTATVGLTVNCARCHDHKFDPIPQQDYYRLWSVFAGVQRGDRNLPITSEVEQDRKRLADVVAELNVLEGAPVRLDDIVAGGNGFGTGRVGHGIDPRNGRPTQAGGQSLANVMPNTYVQAEHPLVDGVFIPDGGPDGKTHVTLTSTSVFVTGLPDTSANCWDYIRSGPSSGAETTKVDGVDYASPGHSMLAMHANKGITFDLQAIREATGYGPLRLRAIAAYGGAAGDYQADFWIYVDAKLKQSKTGLKRKSGGVPVDLKIPADARFLTFVTTDGGNNYSHDQVFFGDLRLVNEGKSNVDPNQAERRAALVAERDALQERVGAAGPSQPADKFYGLLSGKAPTVHMLARGDTESPGQAVTPGTLACIDTLEATLGDNTMPEGKRRLALAEWIVDPRNPLTRRVLVNRLWHYHFGQGLVDTPSDFGFLGGRPSHPELLDWLAEEFLARQWSLKEMHRLMVLSATYRQSSHARDAALAQDADNRLLWRSSPRRLEAEAIRDAVLSISGKLNKEMGGPGYRDFEYIERYAPIYRYITPDRPELWRRSIYRFVVRSVSNELMDVLDCPNPSNLAPRRAETTTALQGLALLNDPFITQQAGHFAERLISDVGADPAAQVRRAFRLALARDPEADELESSVAFVKQHDLFQFCRVLLNTNEFIYVD